MRDEFTNANWYKRGYLPHYDVGGKYQAITYRLADSLPKEVLENLGAPHADAANANSNQSEEIQRRKLIESHLDRSSGSCVLTQRNIVQEVISNWQFFHEQRYELIAYVVMPNHCHVLIKTYEKWPLGKVVRTWKRHLSHFIQKEHGDLWAEYLISYEEYKLATKSFDTSGKSFKSKAASACGAPSKRSLWQREYWDRFIRDEKHFYNAVDYIHQNPVKAGLAKCAKDYNYSSYKEKH